MIIWYILCLIAKAERMLTHGCVFEYSVRDWYLLLRFWTAVLCSTIYNWLLAFLQEATQKSALYWRCFLLHYFYHVYCIFRRFLYSLLKKALWRFVARGLLFLLCFRFTVVQEGRYHGGHGSSAVRNRVDLLVRDDRVTERLQRQFGGAQQASDQYYSVSLFLHVTHILSSVSRFSFPCTTRPPSQGLQPSLGPARRTCRSR